MFDFILKFFKRQTTTERYLNKISTLEKNYLTIFNSQIQESTLEFFTGEFNTLVNKITTYTNYLAASNVEGMNASYLNLRTVYIKDITTTNGKYITKSEFLLFTHKLKELLTLIQQLESKELTIRENRSLLATKKLTEPLYLLIDTLNGEIYERPSSRVIQ